MGIRALCAAAVVAAGVGQAQAATYKVDVYAVEAAYRCLAGPEDCDAPSGPVLGLRTGDATWGLFSLTELASGAYHAEFRVKGSPWYGIVGTLTDGAISGTRWLRGFTYISLDWDGESGGFTYLVDDDPYYPFASLTFDNPVEVAPVPLPASAALLPLGAAAFAFMRRRQVKQAR